MAGELTPSRTLGDPDRPPERARPEPTEAVFVFRAAAHWYAFEATRVQSVVPLGNLTRVPGAPRFVRGVLKAAGRLLVVVDLVPLFQLPRSAAPEPESRRCAVIEADGLPMAIALDEVGGLFRVPQAQLERAEADGAVEATFPLGEGRLVSLLAADRLLALAESKVQGG